MINVSYFEIPLPEDIMKEKWSGHFKECINLINNRLKKDLPDALKKRLLLELEVLERLPLQYPYTYDGVLSDFRSYIPDFSEEDMDELIDLNQLEWIYIEGIKHFHRECIDNIFKTRKDIAKRIIDKEKRDEETQPNEYLNEIIHKMKQQDQVSYRFTIRTTISINKEKPGQRIKVHLPIPIEYRQISDVKIIKVSHPYVESHQDALAHTLYIDTIYSEGMTFEVEYSFINREKYIEVDPSRVSDQQPHFYLEELSPHIVFTPYLRELAREIVGNESNPYLKAKLIYNYITSHVNYSYVRSYFLIEDIAQYGARNLKGDCGIQALLFITLCRICGIPARWQAGLYIFHEICGNHDWAEIYIAPYGWLSVDCSFGGSAFREGSQERREFYFGNLEPYRIPECKDYQASLDPPRTYQRQDPYDNQTGEVEYEDEGLYENDYKTVIKVIKKEELM